MSPKQVLILSAEIFTSFKCKLSIHHTLASSNLDAKVFSANSKIFTSCNCSFAIAHAFEETRWVRKKRHSGTLLGKKIYTKIPPHVKETRLAHWQTEAPLSLCGGKWSICIYLIYNAMHITGVCGCVWPGSDWDLQQFMQMLHWRQQWLKRNDET